MTKQQAILSVVPEREPASLSPARQRLVRAYEHRKATTVAYEKATKEHQRVERLITDTKPIEQKIADLEAANTEFIENWALSGDNAPPKLPHTAEIDRLKSELRKAEIVAEGAKKALQHMNEELQACQQDSTRAIEAIRCAADQVLLEVADDIAKMLGPMEERAALLRLALKSLQQHFLFEGARGRSVGNLSNAVSALIPRSHEPPPQLDKLMGKWSALASRLFTEPESQLEL